MSRRWRKFMRSLSPVGRLRVSIFTLTASVVMLFGVVVVASLLSKPPGFEALPEPERVPAAIVETSTGKSLFVDQKMLDLDLECLNMGDKEQVKSGAKQVRILGRLCRQWEGQKLVATSVINRTNGFEATSFLLKKNRFTTDYIFLSEGENQIMLSLVNDAGEKTVAELKVTR